MQNDRRLQLDAKLREILGSDNVYFQPPPNVKMHYPAIVYNLDGNWTPNANNSTYIYRRNYSVTVIDRDPEKEWDEILTNELEYCKFQRPFVADNLNHWQFSLYW